VAFTFPTGTTIDPGEFIVLARLATTYSGSYQTFEWSSGDLADGGEQITLSDPFGNEVDAVTYDNNSAWPTAPNGSGPSLSYDGSDDNALPGNWAASALVGGTPGGENFPALSLVINEIHYNPVITPTVSYEFIELLNTGATAVYLEDFTLEGVGFTFPANETIDPGEFLVIGADGNTYGGLTWAAGEDLADAGETITLKDAQGNEVDTVPFRSEEH